MRATLKSVVVNLLVGLIVLPCMRLVMVWMNFKIWRISRRNAKLAKSVSRLHAEIAIMKAKHG